MSELESLDTIEAKVGAQRHLIEHVGRAIAAEERVYILHSQRCKETGRDLLECPYSRSLDRGIDLDRWVGFEDRPVKLWIRVRTLQLVPLPIETAIHAVAALSTTERNDHGA